MQDPVKSFQSKDDILRQTDNSDQSSSPYLHVKIVDQYEFLYSDEETGAKMDMTIFRPVPSDKYFIIGDCAGTQVRMTHPDKKAISLCAINDDPNNPMLLPPIDFDRVWTDRGTRGKYDGSLWWPIHPSGYVSIGGVCVPNHALPIIENYRCIREDLVLRSQPGKLIWNDRGSGAKDGDVAIYENDTVDGAFVMARDPNNPYVPPCYKLNPLFVRQEE